MKMPLPQVLARLDYSTGTTPEDRLRSLAGTGVGTVLVNWPNATPYALGWDGRDRHDLAPLEAQLDSLLAIDPSLDFIVAFGSLHGAPYHWAEDHPDELARFACGRRMQAPSLASARWREDSAAAAGRFARTLVAGRHGRRIRGFLPFSTGVDWRGVGETWVNIPAKETPHDHPYPLEGDTSAPMLAAWREHLRSVHGDAEGLAAAWLTPGATPSGAEIPDRVSLRSPTARTRDWFTSYNRLNSRLALAWSDALRREAPAVPVLLPHGLVFGWPSRNLHPQGCGHLDAATLYDAPSIGGLLSAPSAPVTGLRPLSQHPLGSLRLRGLPHVHSIDAPSLCDRTAREQVHAITLQVGYAAVHGSRVAWGEVRQGPGSMQDNRGRFATLPYDHPAVRERVRLLSAWFNSLGTAPARSACPARIAVFHDPWSCLRRGLESRWHQERLDPFREDSLARSGVAFDEYLLEDLPRVGAAFAGWILLDAAAMDDATWALIRARGAAVWSPLEESDLPGAAAVRAFGRRVGAPVLSEEDDLVFASDRVLVHAALASGRKRLALPAACAVSDVLAGRHLGDRLDVLTFEAEAGEVSLFSLDPHGRD